MAKQGIVVAHGGLAQCPPGKRLGSETLKNVVWEGRNQAMHWDEGRYNQPVITCFENLGRDFGPQFSLGGSPASSFAKAVIDMLKWTEFDVYMSDMHSLLG